MPFLEEHEWEIISPLLKDSMLKIKEYRMEHDCDLATAKLNYELIGVRYILICCAALVEKW